MVINILCTIGGVIFGVVIMALFIISSDNIVVKKKRHAYWITTEAYPHWLCCSACYKQIIPNTELLERYNIPLNFCSNCGAEVERNEE